MDANIDSFWPYSTAWQWTHEDLYLHGPATSHSVDTDMDFGISSTLQRNTASAWRPLPESRREYPALPAIPGSTLPQDQPTGGSSQSLVEMVDCIVDVATSHHEGSRLADNPLWNSLWLRVTQAILLRGCGDHQVDHPKLPEHLVEQYFCHFHPLWPLIARDCLDNNDCHPLLQLTTTSIGALYSGSAAAARYGSLMHGKIRNALLSLSSRNEQSEGEALDIGRAMLLTQVAALYFEQEGAFSAAQQLGATLYARAHRMRLFTLKPTPAGRLGQEAINKQASIAEGRRMLAYGMLRAETFMSILFNRKPLLSYEEINLPLPLASFDTASPSHGRDIEEKQYHPCGGVLYSDLVRIALDVDERLPSLRPMDLELLLFGLQQDVWRFSHDPMVFLRLTNKLPPSMQQDQDGCTFSQTPAEHAVTKNSDMLDQTSRKMRALESDYRRTNAALQRWKLAMSHSQLTYPTEQYRSLYLSGLVLYELGFLRLSAPVDAIQQIAYQVHDRSAADDALLAQVTTWTLSPEAREAVTYAQSIWALLSSETSRPKAKQANYNILALMAIHHAAAVIWAVAGTDSQPDLVFDIRKHTSTPNQNSLVLQRTNTKAIMNHFANLYPKITSSWGMQSSFHKTVKKLGDHLLPQQSNVTRAVEDEIVLQGGITPHGAE
ncbi:hypothetical protein LTR37_013554 [Vermiconidia calcicola]|uniref:Uncharacterized protein n=1 Tax=Vermiconidia calcicola TaxID=1690605 RepID=A0ACC3MWP9_9PEZI|nr:hypothetical protein LTR37_013554 [Vermiconidia calcicola]